MAGALPDQRVEQGAIHLATLDDEHHVGMVEVVSPTRARILMPLPMLESDLNILLLTR